MEQIRMGEPQDGSIGRGIVVLVVSFFTMPFKTLRIAASTLRDVGSKGKLDTGSTSIPHLTWLLAAGYLLISLIIIVVIAASVLWAAGSFVSSIRYSPAQAMGGLILYPLGGVLAAVLVDWSLSVSLELLALFIEMGNNVKKIASR